MTNSLYDIWLICIYQFAVFNVKSSLFFCLIYKWCYDCRLKIEIRKKALRTQGQKSKAKIRSWAAAAAAPSAAAAGFGTSSSNSKLWLFYELQAAWAVQDSRQNWAVCGNLCESMLLSYTYGVLYSYVTKLLHT